MLPTGNAHWPAIVIAVLLGISGSGSGLAADDRPNILLLVADDMGYSDPGCYGGEIETPQLDGLAKRGLRLTNYYVNNMCFPTRASLLSGLYPKTALVGGASSKGLRPSVTTLPQALHDAGYATYMSGKWHLSDSAKPDSPNAPHHRGFDKFYGTIDGASDFFAPADLQLNGKDMTDQWKNNPDFYYTDAITDQAIDFLKERPADKPFFLYVAYTAAHWPLHARPEDIEHYAGRYSAGWDRLRDQRYARMKDLGVIDSSCELSPRNPSVPEWQDEQHKPWQSRRMEVYAAQVTTMDRNIGRILDFLKANGSFDNTLILYQHDNGGCHVEYEPKRTGSWTREFTTDGKQTPIKPGNIPDLMPGPQSTFQSYGHGWANVSNTPFRLFKQHDHEGGTRSPLIISWPKGLAAKQAGGLSREFCHVVDIMPTLIEISGAELSQQKPLAFEGRSFASLIQSGVPPSTQRGPIFWAHAKGKAVRDGDWKLVSVEKQDWELYDLSTDATELHDLAKKYPERVELMSRMFAEWLKRTDLK